MNPRLEAPVRRGQLLGAARQVFGEKGYESATVSEIVARAGVSQGTFYTYFPSKQAVPGAIAEELMACTARACEKAAARADSLEEAIGVIVEAACEEARAFRDVFLIANRGTYLVEQEEEWQRITAPLRQALASCIRHWQDAGEADSSLDPEISASVAVGMLSHAAGALVVFERISSAPEVTRMLRWALEAR